MIKYDDPKALPVELAAEMHWHSKRQLMQILLFILSFLTISHKVC